MDSEKAVMLFSGLFIAVVVGLLIGSLAFPREVVKTIEKPVDRIVEKRVEVPVEKIVEKEVIKEVQVVDEALKAEFDNLVIRYEQMSDSDYSSSDVQKEIAWIAKAERDFVEYKHMLLLDDYSLGETKVQKFYGEQVSLVDVSRIVDGKRRTFEKPTIDFEVKVKYEDSNGAEYERWAVRMVYDVNLDGEETLTVDVDQL